MFILLLILILILFLIRGGDDKEKVMEILRDLKRNVYSSIFIDGDVEEIRGRHNVNTDSKENVINFIKSVTMPVFWDLIDIRGNTKSYYIGWLVKAFKKKWTININHTIGENGETKYEGITDNKEFLKGYNENYVDFLIPAMSSSSNTVCTKSLESKDFCDKLYNSVKLFDENYVHGQQMFFRIGVKNYGQLKINGLVSIEKFQTRSFRWIIDDFCVDINREGGLDGIDYQDIITINNNSMHIKLRGFKSCDTNVHKLLFKKGLIADEKSGGDFYLSSKGVNPSHTKFVYYAIAMLFMKEYKNFREDDEINDEILENLFFQKIEFVINLSTQSNFYETVIDLLLGKKSEDFTIKKLNCKFMPLYDIVEMGEVNQINKVNDFEKINFLNTNRFSKIFPCGVFSKLKNYGAVIEKNKYVLTMYFEGKPEEATITRSSENKYYAEYEGHEKKYPINIINLIKRLKPGIITLTINGRTELINSSDKDKSARVFIKK
jgi:hypothetical protein